MWWIPLQAPAPGSFAERVVVGETPLFSSRPDGIDPFLDPSKVDLWAYSYRSVQRPLVRVREEIGEDAISAVPIGVLMIAMPTRLG